MFPPPEKQVREQERIKKMLLFIEEQLAEELYLSQGYLFRFFKSRFGMSFEKYVTMVRLYYALDALTSTDAPIIDIALEQGFPNVASFNKAVKDTYGETPGQIRKKKIRRQAKSCRTAGVI